MHPSAFIYCIAALRAEEGKPVDEDFPILARPPGRALQADGVCRVGRALCESGPDIRASVPLSGRVGTSPWVFPMAYSLVRAVLSTLDLENVFSRDT